MPFSNVCSGARLYKKFYDFSGRLAQILAIARAKGQAKLGRIFF